MELSANKLRDHPQSPRRSRRGIEQYNPDFDRIAIDAETAMMRSLMQQVLGREEPYSLEIKDPRSNFFNGWAKLRGKTVNLPGRCASTATKIPDSEVIDADPYFGTFKHDTREINAMHREAIRRVIKPRRLSELPRPQGESAHPLFAMSMTEDHGQYPFEYVLGLVEPLSRTPLERKFLSRFGCDQASSDDSHIVWMPGDGWNLSWINAKPFSEREPLSVVEIPELEGKIPSLERLLAKINRKVRLATNGKGWEALRPRNY